MESDLPAPTGGIVRGSVTFPSDSELVTDADEEVFLLYSNLQAKNTSDPAGFRGLGHVDSRKDTLTIAFELMPPADQPPPTLAPTSRKHRHHKHPSKAKPDKIGPRTVEIALMQDKTALRTRKGDTGSVLWRASIDLAQLVLQQIHARTPFPLLNPALLKTQHILELGAGTGLLAAAFAPLAGRYTLTDLPALLPLLRKNAALNFPGWPSPSPTAAAAAPGSNLHIDALDWALLLSTPPPRRAALFPFPPVDLLLVVDCIYHPALLPALVETIAFLAVPGRTAVLVLVELRAEDVVRAFLEMWVGRGGWEVWRAGEGGAGAGGAVEGPYAMWLGWRVV